MVYLGATKTLRVTWRDIDETLLTPDTQEWIIKDSKGVTKETLAEDDLSIVSEGVYRYDYLVPEDGETGPWKLIAKAKKLSDPVDRWGVQVKQFEVTAP
ncbi:MAG: hypothetical protein HWN68_02305 [Desulfobacterales bacterium]|nr:hypothetical protein [Desulfobacterales bacterium]